MDELDDCSTGFKPRLKGSEKWACLCSRGGNTGVLWRGKRHFFRRWRRGRAPCVPEMASARRPPEAAAS